MFALDKFKALPVNRSSENKALSYRWTGQRELARVTVFTAKVILSKWCGGGEGRSVSDQF